MDVLSVLFCFRLKAALQANGTRWYAFLVESVMASRCKVACRAPDGDNREGNSSSGQVASKAVGETPNSGQKLRPVERSFKITEEEFEKKFKTPLARIFSHVRELRNDMASKPDLQEKHKEVIEKINKVDHDIWDVHCWTPSFARRLRIQSQKLKKASVKTCLKEESPSKPKSAARKEAGKKKAGSLALWMQACKDARSALKAEGYSGSINMKRGGPMHTKALELLKDRTAAGASASSGSAPTR